MKKLFLSVAPLLLLAGCANYMPKNLETLHKSKNFRVAHSKDKLVTLKYHPLSISESKRYLDRNLLIKVFQPIQISITNATDKMLYFFGAKVAPRTVDTSTIADAMYTNTTGRAVGYSIASLILWPFLIPAIVDGVGSHQANQKIDNDLAQKVLTYATIAPQQTVSGLIFVRKAEFDGSLSISLSQDNTDKSILVSTQN